MGKGTIISGGPTGSYSVELKYDTSQIAARTLAIQGRIVVVEIAKTEAENALASLENEYSDIRAEQDALIDALNANPSAEGLAALNAKSKELAAKAVEVGRQTFIVDQAALELTALRKELAALVVLPSSSIVAAWCADYTEGLAGDVGTVEVPSGDLAQHVQIRPGVGGAAAYSASRDGAMRHPAADVPAGVYWNLAMQPGVQKWLPRYRLAEITAIDADADTCSIAIDSATAQQQGLSLDNGTTFDDVQIDYMDCNAAVFEIGDRVLVEFFDQDQADPDGNWAAGKMHVIGFEDNPEPCGYAGAFIFYPLSDGNYGWGDPYENPPGTPVNPPLGTVSGGYYCGAGVTTIDGSKHEYRLYDSADAPNYITHATPAISGRHWWKYDDYVISWSAPNRMDSASNIYRNGNIFSDGPGGVLAGACVRKIASTTYLYAWRSVGSTSGLLQRAVVNPIGTNQTLTWSGSTGIVPAVASMAPPFESAAGAVKASFNKSGTRVALSQPGRLVVFDIDTWGSEYVVSDTWYEDSEAQGDPVSTIEIPVTAAYIPDSDTLRKVSIRITNDTSGAGGQDDIFYVEPFVAEVIRDGEVIKRQPLYITNQAVEFDNENPPPPNQIRILNGIYFFCMYPWNQSPETDTYFYSTMKVRDENFYYSTAENENEYSYSRFHFYEVYRGAVLQNKMTKTEIHPDMGSVSYQNLNWEKGIKANNRQLRDEYYYPQFNVDYRNERWSLSQPQTFAWLAQECIGVWMFDDIGQHFVLEHQPLHNKRLDPITTYGPHHNIAMAHHWDKASVYSMRNFAGWDDADPPNAVLEWDHVYLRVPDLMDETQVVGDNQRMLTRPCALDLASRPYVDHIAINHFSTENPFA